ncbi:hypothetical protein NDU88_007447 [Pleurodeles waltl]|uniref:Uncharacterized protein n=1 Tax=Pleurodeles waltl TaxID=8319 RepID=A0AAV7PLN7_PLEWA|nr:hypothetical protein NDU88_007447 [Pleurodeles waltl]
MAVSSHARITVRTMAESIRQLDAWRARLPFQTAHSRTLAPFSRPKSSAVSTARTISPGYDGRTPQQGCCRLPSFGHSCNHLIPRLASELVSGAVGYLATGHSPAPVPSPCWDPF